MTNNCIIVWLFYIMHTQRAFFSISRNHFNFSFVNLPLSGKLMISLMTKLQLMANVTTAEHYS